MFVLINNHIAIARNKPQASILTVSYADCVGPQFCPIRLVINLWDLEGQLKLDARCFLLWCGAVVWDDCKSLENMSTGWKQRSQNYKKYLTDGQLLVIEELRP